MTNLPTGLLDDLEEIKAMIDLTRMAAQSIDDDDDRAAIDAGAYASLTLVRALIGKLKYAS